MKPQQKVDYFIYDKWLLILSAALLSIGFLMVASSSMVISDKTYNAPFHFLIHQLMYIGVGVFLGLIIIRIPIIFWKKISNYLLLFSFIALILVLVPGIGKEVNGSIRWIGFGPVELQVSEFAKFSIITYLASYLVRRESEVRQSFRGFIKPMIIIGMMGILLLMEPDFGAVSVITLAALGMIFLSGARLWQFVVLMVIVAGGLSTLAIASPYRLLRLTTFLHPWANAFSSGYQLTQSLIAFGRGGIFGVGLGNSIQKLFYLPEAHTDFLFAVLGEEFGLLGELVVIALFAMLVTRIFIVSKKAYSNGTKFSAYMAYGFALWIGLQAIINIGVNSGLLPTKGLTLPFMSYGGSSMMLNFVVLAILMRISHEAEK
jgi:cell division protein FtsW